MSQGTGSTGKGKKLEPVEPAGLTVATVAASSAKRAKKETPREAEPLKETSGGRAKRTFFGGFLVVAYR